ncbi:IS3 family transposase [Aggregatibacter actinomycetemcomitans]|nr:IS3 family transposase [Aggregatibacter actinomycetemcomitans]
MSVSLRTLTELDRTIHDYIRYYTEERISLI